MEGGSRYCSLHLGGQLRKLFCRCSGGPGREGGAAQANLQRLDKRRTDSLLGRQCVLGYLIKYLLRTSYELNHNPARLLFSLLDLHHPHSVRQTLFDRPPRRLSSGFLIEAYKAHTPVASSPQKVSGRSSPSTEATSLPRTRLTSHCSAFERSFMISVGHGRRTRSPVISS